MSLRAQKVLTLFTLITISILLQSCSSTEYFVSRSPDGQFVYHKYYAGYETMNHGLPYPNSRAYKELAIYDDEGYQSNEKSIRSKINEQ